MLNNGTAIKFDKYMRYHNDNPVLGTVSGGAPNGRLYITVGKDSYIICIPKTKTIPSCTIPLYLQHQLKVVIFYQASITPRSYWIDPVVDRSCIENIESFLKS